MTYRHTPQSCPKCGECVDAATAVDRDDPSPPVAGNIAVCFNCGFVMKYKGDPPVPSIMTVEEQLDVINDREVMDTLIKIALAKRITLQ